MLATAKNFDLYLNLSVVQDDELHPKLNMDLNLKPNLELNLEPNLELNLKLNLEPNMKLCVYPKHKVSTITNAEEEYPLSND